MAEPYPAAAPNVVTDPVAEEAYRQQLVGEFVEASIGTVGLHTPIDLKRAGYDHIGETIRDRAQMAHPEIEGRESIQLSPSIVAGTPGYGQYGERPVRDHEDVIAQYMPKHEVDNPGTLQFFKLPDGNTDVRYSIGTQGYNDHTNRQTVLDMSFILNADAASRLTDVVRLDPRFADDLVKAQAVALGIPEDYVNTKIAPRQTLRNGIPATVERTLTLEQYSYDETGVHKEAEQLSFAKSYGKGRVSIIPEAVPEAATEAAEEPSPDVTPTFDMVAVQAEADTLQAQFSSKFESIFERRGIENPDDKLSHLATMVGKLKQSAPAATDAPAALRHNAIALVCERLATEYVIDLVQSDVGFDARDEAGSQAYLTNKIAEARSKRQALESAGEDGTAQEVYEAGYAGVLRNIRSQQ